MGKGKKKHNTERDIKSRKRNERREKALGTLKYASNEHKFKKQNNTIPKLISQKQKIIDAIRSNFGTDIKENILQIQYELSLEIFLILIGTILLVTSKIFETLDTVVIDDVISIFGWVMIWEAAYHFIFVDIKKLIENKRLKKLTEAKIKFKQKD